MASGEGVMKENQAVGGVKCESQRENGGMVASMKKA
jgi:hypothetical protein